MSNIRCWLLTLSLTASCATAVAQDAGSILAKDALSAQDTLSIISLLDSLLEFDNTLGSQLAIRLGYNSNVLSAGRTLGIQNFGLAPALSYYHKSGLYADVTAYWSKDFDPSYYLTVASVGYLYALSPHFSMMAEYDHYFYNTGSSTTYIPYENTLTLSPVIEYKPVSFTVNYSYYFGEQSAHRLMPGLSFTLEKKKFWILDKISLLPSAYILWGNETITTLEYVSPTTVRETIQNLSQYGTRYRPQQTDTEVFGIMNYTFALPLNVTYRNWSLLLTYAYNIPKALPGEPMTLSESSYLSGSLTYLIDLRPNKKLL